MNRSLRFLEDYSSINTIRLYKGTIESFLKSVYNQQNINLEQTADQYVNEKRDFREDVRNWFAGLQVKNTHPMSMKIRLSIVRVFLSENDIELPLKFWRSMRLRVKGSRPRTVDQIPTNAELRK